MEIDWDNHDGSTRNRGTDGHGVVAQYDVIEDEEASREEGPQVVHLNFHFYADGDERVKGRQLSHLCRAINTLIHKHLG